MQGKKKICHKNILIFGTIIIIVFYYDDLENIYAISTKDLFEVALLECISYPRTLWNTIFFSRGGNITVV